jgi:hypothetical protein
MEDEASERYAMSKEVLDFDLGLCVEWSELVEYQRRKLSGHGVIIGVLSDEQVKDIVLVLLKIQEQFNSFVYFLIVYLWAPEGLYHLWF